MDMNLKKILKSIINKKLYLFLSNYLYKSFSPFKIRSLIYPKSQYSDFFIYATNLYKIEFIAENIHAIYEGKKFLLRHIFRFYDGDGILLKKFIFEDDDFFSNIELPKINTKHRYISFSHETKIINQNLLNKEFKKLIKKRIIGIHHRGYTIYKENESSLGSLVHGNFGGLYPCKIKNSAALQRNRFFKYTPAFLFNHLDKYHFVFNNPTEKELSIEMELFDKSNKLIKNSTININPYGSNFFEIKNTSGKVSFKSKLPITRPLIFKNPYENSFNFDVFHS